MSTDPKYCEDCLFFQGEPGDTGGWLARCQHGSPVPANLVRRATERPLCVVVRGRSHQCGQDGKWFEPKEIAS